MSHHKQEEIGDSPSMIRWMAENKVASNLLMILLLAGGVFFYSQMTKEVFPSFQMDTVSIQVAYPGASPSEVESAMLLAIEDAINGIEGLGEIVSTATEGGGRVTVEVTDPDEIIRIAQDIQGAVDRITTFPEEAEDPIVAVDSRQIEVMTLVIFGEAEDSVLLEAAEELRDQLLQDKQVGPVSVSGYREQEIHVEISQEKLKALGLSLSDVANQLRSSAIEVPAGTLDTRGGEIMLRLTARRQYAVEFAHLPIRSAVSGAVLRLGDIATVREDYETTDQRSLFNGKPSVMVGISRIGNQTPISVAKATKEIIRQAERHLPDGLSIDILNDRSKTYQERADLLVKNGLIGLVLVVLFLALFLDVRLAFWVAMGIPISFAGAFLIFTFTDMSINMISMFAFIIALGIVVDDAIVVGENIYSWREKGLSPLESAVRGAKEVAVPVTFSVITNMIAFIPLYFVPGMMGRIFGVIPVVVATVFGISLIESLFILPSHLKLKNLSRPVRQEGLGTFIKMMHQRFNDKFLHFVSVYYRAFLHLLLRYRYAVIAAGLAVLMGVGGYVLSGRMGLILFPRIESDYAFAQIVLPPGSPQERVDQLLEQVLDAAGRVIGRYPEGELATGLYTVVNANTIESRIYLVPASERPESTTEVTQRWRQETGVLTGVQSSTFVSNRGGPGSGAALTVQLSHRDIAVLEQAARSLAKELEAFPNTSDIDDGSARGKRQMDFELKEIAQRIGLTAREIVSQVRAAVYGIEAFRQQRQKNEITLRVRLPEAQRRSLHDLDYLLIRSPGGVEAYLSDLVEFKEGRAYTSINRSNGRRILSVMADVEPQSDTNKVINVLKQTTLPELQQTYPGLSYSFEGRQADMRDSIKTLRSGLIVVLIVIYALLALMFRSYVQPLLVMFAIPFSIIGAVFGHFLMGYSMSIMSLFGLLALTGVVVNDSLVLIDFANHNRRRIDSVTDSLVEAAVRRFRPIMLTTLTTFVGLAPMIFETSRQARFLIPMALSLGFGIIFATMITLLFVPALYMIIEDIQAVLHRKPTVQNEAAEQPKMDFRTHC